MDEQPRLQILKLIEAGKLSAEEGIRLLNALSGTTAVAAAEAKLAPAPEAVAPKSAPIAAPHSGERESATVVPTRSDSPAHSKNAPAPQSPPPDFAYWRSWWRLPFALGTAFTIIIAALAFWAWRAADNQLSVWFGLLMCPLAFGLLVMILALASRTAKWLHLRVNTGKGEFPRQRSGREKSADALRQRRAAPPRRIALSLPMPIGPLRWVVNLIAQFNPELRERGVPQMIAALGSDLSSDNPLYVEVYEGEDGEKVQVYIG